MQDVDGRGEGPFEMRHLYGGDDWWDWRWSSGGRRDCRERRGVGVSMCLETWELHVGRIHGSLE